MSNGVGNITNSQIEKIEQQVQYNGVLSEEIREAILLITSLTKEDLEWKRAERGKIMLERLTAEKRNYSLSVFDKAVSLLLIPVVLLLTYSTWATILSPLIKFLNKNGFSFINFWHASKWVGQQLVANENTFYFWLIVGVVYAIFSALLAVWIAKKRAKRKYESQFTEIKKRFECE